MVFYNIFITYYSYLHLFKSESIQMNRKINYKIQLIFLYNYSNTSELMCLYKL